MSGGSLYGEGGPCLGLRRSLYGEGRQARTSGRMAREDRPGLVPGRGGGQVNMFKRWKCGHMGTPLLDIQNDKKTRLKTLPSAPCWWEVIQVRNG